LDIWREGLIQEDEDDDNVMPEVERMALEAEERAFQAQAKAGDMIVKNGEEAKKSRRLFGRRERRDVGFHCSSLDSLLYVF
jgi:hypothetical protein